MLTDGASVLQVESAETQLVNGMNYRITVRTSVGTVNLELYELQRSNVLTLTRATLSPASRGNSFAIMMLDLIDEELELDAAAFTSAANGCTGGQVWRPCGRPCTATCDQPNPICTRMCAQRCECPNEKPLWKDEQCIEQTSCVTEEPAKPPVEEAVPLMGGWQAASETQQGSKIHNLAAFALAHLQASCAPSNALGCRGLPDATFHSVTSAQTQVVAGKKYSIEARTSAGNLHLVIYERAWGTRVLQISEAVLTVPQQAGLLGQQHGDLLAALGQESVALDAEAFEVFNTPLHGALMIGGMTGPAAATNNHYVTSDQALLAAASTTQTEGEARNTPTAAAPAAEAPTDEAPAARPPAGVSACCEASTASCLACSASMTVEEYCRANPLQVGCEKERDAETQWWLFTFFVVGVLLVALLSVVGRHLQRTAKPDELPINANATRSSSAEVEVEKIEEAVRKGDSSIA